MLNRFKTALYNVVGSFDPGEGTLGGLAPGVTASLPSSGIATRASVLTGGGRDRVSRIFILQLSSV